MFNMSFSPLLQYFQYTLIEGNVFSNCSNKRGEFGLSCTRQVCVQIAFHSASERNYFISAAAREPRCFQIRNFKWKCPNSSAANAANSGDRCWPATSSSWLCGAANSEIVLLTVASFLRAAFSRAALSKKWRPAANCSAVGANSCFPS